MKRTSIAIVGMGPRGLSIFERIAAHARASGAALQLHLVEPNGCGPGVHTPHQPQHLLINTIASQVTIFPSAGMADPAPACATPSLTEWARAQGYRRFGERYFQVDPGCPGGADLSDADYLPRPLLGEYLAWAYAAIAATLPATVALRHWRQRAADLLRQPDGRFVLELEDGAMLASDFVFLCTGHGRNRPGEQEQAWAEFARDCACRNPRLAYIRHVYPLARLAAVEREASVGIAGIGLTAHDVIAELTAGRGGSFIRSGASLRYLRSGQEPKLLLFSRQCLPAAARGVNQKGVSGRHQARFFTRAAVRTLRGPGRRQLDFERELLPLLLREMGLAWRTASDGTAPLDYALGSEEGAAIDRLLFPLRGRGFEDAAEFADFLHRWIVEDLHQARRGNLASPAKAAADVLRDVRAVLQEAVEHGGLTPASHRLFLEVYNPAINRIAFGPPRLRNQQLLALAGAGLLAFAAGPGPVLEIDEERAQFALHSAFPAGDVRQYLDALVIARLDVFSPHTDDSPLMRKLLARGLLRPYLNGGFHPGGLDVDPAHHPRSRAGQPVAGLWALGYLAEGANYYTHALPRPQLASRQVLDAARCVAELFAAVGMHNRSLHA